MSSQNISPTLSEQTYNHGMKRFLASFLHCSVVLLLPTSLFAQAVSSAPLAVPFSQQPSHVLIPVPLDKLPPGTLELLKLEGEFSDAVTKGGGKAFVSWFADDGVTLNNGKPVVQGKFAIAATANWDPKEYQLSWYAQGAQMAPSGDAGFTWGHYDAGTKDKNGLPITVSGRYFTFWKKVDGKWKVALDASAEEPAQATVNTFGNIPPPK
jgi:ketosteroid isomerase-like protein